MKLSTRKLKLGLLKLFNLKDGREKMREEVGERKRERERKSEKERGGGEKEGEREKDKKGERETERETDTQRERERERERMGGQCTNFNSSFIILRDQGLKGAL